MEVFEKVVTVKYIPYEMDEKEVFIRYVKEIRVFKNEKEVDFLKTSDHKDYVCRFKTLSYDDLILDNYESLEQDIMCLSVYEFWKKYKNKLTGIWNKDIRIVI